MRPVLTILVAGLAFLAGLSAQPRGLFLGLLAGLVAYLALSVQELRRRVARLEAERTESARTDAATTAAPASPPPVPPTAPAPMSLPPAATEPGTGPPTESPPPRRRLADLFAPVVGFLTRGNPVLKAGLVVLFFGVAFLLKYAAQRELIPLELRLAAVAAGGLALLCTGWLLRRRHALYGLGLQGGGIGILYLVVFAAARLYQLLPMPLAFALLVTLVGLSCLLAVLQEARTLATAGTIGGFLAPVLLSTGAGSHVQLFTYYALLNAGILAIAWFKAWRELNLVGFVCTFGIATLWGVLGYRPELFASTEPFLLFFFLLYVAVSVLFALRQPLVLRGLVDGPLVFGLPLVFAGLQTALVQEFRYGLAYSALGLGLFYTLLARAIWHRAAGSLRLLGECFLALSLVFASLAIPLGLDPAWTTAAWSLEGAALVWLGVRQGRRGLVRFGLVLQAGAGLAFFAQAALPPGSLTLANRVFLGCALLAGAGLCSARWLEQDPDPALASRPRVIDLVLAWALGWWYVGGYRDLDWHLHWRALFPAFLLFACLTAAALAPLARRLAWPRLAATLLVLLPLAWLALAGQALPHGGPLLVGWGWLAWPLLFLLHFVLLRRCEPLLPARLTPAWHAAGLWLLLVVLALETSARVARLPALAPAWSAACQGVVPAALLLVLHRFGRRLAWPIDRFPAAYLGAGADPALVVLLLWTAASFTLNGDPAPLGYLPLFNPLELAEMAVLLTVGFSLPRLAPGTGRQGRLALTTLFVFAFLNVMVGRTVHFFFATAYTPAALFASPVLQAAVAALWGVLALGLTVRGARTSDRRAWLAGAGLLGLTVAKLFLIDLASAGTVGRIVSFLVVGLLMLVIGFFAPLPPKTRESR